MDRLAGIAIFGAKPQLITVRHLAPIGILMLVVGAFIAPDAPFIIDGGIYYDMARAMAEHGSLAIASNGGVDGAPPLTKLLTVAHNGYVYTQYPSGYALLAAPFYAAFGIHGLMLMNALAFAVCVRLTFAIGRRLYNDDIARWSAGIFALATFAPTYAFGIWPHMLALACWLGAAYCAIRAVQTAERKHIYQWLTLCGVIISAGVNIRVDTILAALVVFFWLRLFALPRDRLAPVFAFLGMAPGLLLAAWLNQIKFGAFSPFAYGQTSGADTLGHYIPILAAAAGAVAVSWAMNAPAMVRVAMRRDFRRISCAAVAIILIAALSVSGIRELVWRTATGIYVLVINLQAHDAYYQAGVERNQFGQLLFWGYPKKALIQSLPWMALIVIPAVNALRGRYVTAVGLCVLAVSAPVCFYALSHWHGGGSYNMRYFTPALPFLAILAAASLYSLRGDLKFSRPAILGALTIAAALYLGLQEVGQSAERLFAPAALYPQWIIAALLAIACIAHLVMEQMRKPASMLALFAIAYAVAINIYEEIGHERTRAEQIARANDISAPIPKDSLVITPLQTSLIPAERSGVFVMAAMEESAPLAAQAAAAFAQSGRCVYFHNVLAAKLTAPYLDIAIDPEPIWAPSKNFAGDPRLAFYLLETAPSACRF